MISIHILGDLKSIPHSSRTSVYTFIMEVTPPVLLHKSSKNTIGLCKYTLNHNQFDNYSHEIDLLMAFLFLSIVCNFFCGYKGFCQRIESDLLLFFLVIIEHLFFSLLSPEKKKREIDAGDHVTLRGKVFLVRICRQVAVFC